MAEVWAPPVFDDVATSELVTAAQLNALGNSLRFLKEVNYTAYTSAVNVSATTVGTANQIVSSGAITYEAVPHWIEFYCPVVTSIGADTNVIIRDGSTVIGTLNQLDSTVLQSGPYLAKYRVTPTAASHTYNVAAWLGGADTVVFSAGTGGTAGDLTTLVAGYIWITRIPT